jgi:hypothetical protein
MQETLKNIKKIIIDPTAGKNVLPYLPLPELSSASPAHKQKKDE